jgi:hypothetical protein
MKGEMRRHIRVTSNSPSLSIMNFHSRLLPDLSSLNLSSAESSFNQGGSKTHIDKVDIVGCGMYHSPKCKLVRYLFMELPLAPLSISH